MLPIAAVLALSLAAPPACALPRPVADLAWTRGERLTYDIQVLGGLKRGGAVLATTPLSSWIDLAADAHFSAPFLSFRGTAHSSIDALTLKPRQFNDQLNDGTPRTTFSNFLRPGLALRVESTIGGKPSMNAFVKGPRVFDVVSAVYSLRSVDLEPGAAFCFEAVGGRHYWRLNGHRQGGTERIDTPAGSFQAIRHEAVAVQADDASVRHQLRLWISADARRLPVAMELDSRFGVIRGVLAAVAP